MWVSFHASDVPSVVRAQTRKRDILRSTGLSTVHLDLQMPICRMPICRSLQPCASIHIVGAWASKYSISNQGWWPPDNHWERLLYPAVSWTPLLYTVCTVGYCTVDPCLQLAILYSWLLLPPRPGAVWLRTGQVSESRMCVRPKELTHTAKEPVNLNSTIATADLDIRLCVNMRHMEPQGKKK